MINVILAGGSGSRLWPISRTMLPKQFVRMFQGKSLFQKTFLRNRKSCSKCLITLNKDHYYLALDQLDLGKEDSIQFLLEQVGRDTAPAIALACMAIHPEQVVLVTSSDHIIHDHEAYDNAIAEAKQLALQDYIVTFGIDPTYAETGYGYIEAAGRDVLSFKEKPDLVTAKRYLDKGNFYWNSGMYCFKAGVLLNEIEKLDKKFFSACKKAMQNIDTTESVIDIDLDLMLNIPPNSIDYTLMEKSQKMKVIPCAIGWSDLGSFDSLYKELKNEDEYNTIFQQLDISPSPILVDSKNNFILNRERQIAMVDVCNLMVVDTSDALLIINKNSSQKVKRVVDTIKETNSQLTEVHRMAYRPWGSYEVLIDTSGYKVKRIIVKPGGRLSLQKHFHRNEHWIVVSGTATVTVDEKVFLVRPNESTYITMGQNHRLENNGKIDLVIIEVQVGEYTGEDDIIRLKDIYDMRKK